MSRLLNLQDNQIGMIVMDSQRLGIGTTTAEGSGFAIQDFLLGLYQYSML